MSQRFCTQCGAALSGGKFCTQCGAAVEGVVAPPTSMQPVSPPAQSLVRESTPVTGSDAQPGESRVMLYSLGGLAVVLVLAAATYFGLQRPAVEEQTTERQTAQVVQNAPDIPFPDVARMTVEDAHASFEEGTAIFVDVRDRDSYTAMHIPGAVWMSWDEVEMRHGELPRDAEIITYCT